MFAIGLDSAKNLAIAITIGFVALAFVSALVIKNVTTKIVSVLIMAGLALGVWTQRAQLQDCAQTMKDKVEVHDTSATTCTFFGLDVDIPGVTTE
jgi:high-affinity Fe2+/Pb2+ permease